MVNLLTTTPLAVHNASDLPITVSLTQAGVRDERGPVVPGDTVEFDGVDRQRQAHVVVERVHLAPPSVEGIQEQLRLMLTVARDAHQPDLRHRLLMVKDYLRALLLPAHDAHLARLFSNRGLGRFRRHGETTMTEAKPYQVTATQLAEAILDAARAGRLVPESATDKAFREACAILLTKAEAMRKGGEHRAVQTVRAEVMVMAACEVAAAEQQPQGHA